jgi:hypothetical protein
MLAVGPASGANSATTPSWRTVLTAVNGTANNQFAPATATGRTTGWAFLNDPTFAYERTSATTWEKVAFPGRDGAVNIAAASSPSNV